MALALYSVYFIRQSNRKVEHTTQSSARDSEAARGRAVAGSPATIDGAFRMLPAVRLPSTDHSGPERSRLSCC